MKSCLLAKDDDFFALEEITDVSPPFLTEFPAMLSAVAASGVAYPPPAVIDRDEPFYCPSDSCSALALPFELASLAESFTLRVCSSNLSSASPTKEDALSG